MGHAIDGGSAGCRPRAVATRGAPQSEVVQAGGGSVHPAHHAPLAIAVFPGAEPDAPALDSLVGRAWGLRVGPGSGVRVSGRTSSPASQTLPVIPLSPEPSKETAQQGRADRGRKERGPSTGRSQETPVLRASSSPSKTLPSSVLQLVRLETVAARTAGEEQSEALQELYVQVCLIWQQPQSQEHKHPDP